MNDKQREFGTFIFSKIYGTLTDENGELYVEVYQYEIEELIKNMFVDLNIILKVFGEIYLSDISKVFVLHFWDTDKIVDYDIDEIAFKFNDLYSLGG